MDFSTWTRDDFIAFDNQRNLVFQPTQEELQAQEQAKQDAFNNMVNETKNHLSKYWIVFNWDETDFRDLLTQYIYGDWVPLSDEEKEAGVVLIDIGGGTTDIAIFYEGIIRHTAVIPFGGNSITEDIREGCAVMKNTAEALKVKFGSALADENKDEEVISIQGLRGREPKEVSVKNLAYIIQARMEEIITFYHKNLQ